MSLSEEIVTRAEGCIRDMMTIARMDANRSRIIGISIVNETYLSGVIRGYASGFVNALFCLERYDESAVREIWRIENAAINELDFLSGAYLEGWVK